VAEIRKMRGCVHRLSGTLSTDDILPARYKHTTTDPFELATHVFEYAQPGLASRLRADEILVADGTFGIGSSREQAVSALKAAGVIAVLAPAFGRIFFRNCWNLGMPAIEVMVPSLEDGDRVTIDLVRGICLSDDGAVEFQSINETLIKMVEAGGLLAQVAAGAGLPSA
jgi:3-isopropylmalate/(R)-2-methylmalate dehydratase small subunit